MISRTADIFSRLYRETKKETTRTVHADNIDELRKYVESTTEHYIIRQLSADENTEILRRNRVQMGVPVIPVHGHEDSQMYVPISSRVESA